MKKMIALSICCFMLFCTGCKSGKTETMNCSRVVDQAGIKFDLSYKVVYKNNFVTSIHSIEKIISDDAFVLQSYMDEVNGIYEPYKGLNHYDYNVAIDGNTLISRIDIDYTKVDTKKMIEIDPNNSDLIYNGKIDIDTMRAYYETIGIVCE